MLAKKRIIMYTVRVFYLIEQANLIDIFLMRFSIERLRKNEKKNTVQRKKSLDGGVL